MWNTDGKPDDMPLEEWLWITKQHKPHKGGSDEDKE